MIKFVLRGKCEVFYLLKSAFMIHYVRSEDSEKGSSVGDGADQAAFWDDFEYTTNNGTVKAYWSQNYTIIYQSNSVIYSVDNLNSKDDASQRNKGEALFFRAYCYFNLVRAFGEVPLVTAKIRDAAEANVPKTTAEKIYEQIDKDLDEAEKLLPKQWSSEYIGRLTWGAARALHEDGIYPENDKNIVTIGGSGFGMMAILAGVKRGYVTDKQGFARFEKIISFLERADRFHAITRSYLIEIRTCQSIDQTSLIKIAFRNTRSQLKVGVGGTIYIRF